MRSHPRIWQCYSAIVPAASAAAVLLLAIGAFRPPAALATPEPYTVFASDVNGNGVTGATVSAFVYSPIGTGSLAAPTTFTGGSGNVTISTVTSGTPSSLPVALPGSATTYTIVERSGGYYVVVYDAEANGEAQFTLTFTKAATTFLNSGLVTITCSRDSSRILTSLPTAAPAANGGLPTVNGSNFVAGVANAPTNWPSMSIDGSGRVLLQPTQTGVTIPTVTALTNGVNVTQIAGQTASAAAGVTFPSTISSYGGADTSGTTTLLSRIPGTVQPQTGDAYARLGAPTGASISADIAGVQTTSTSNGTAITAVSTKLGTPAGASVSADIAANLTAVNGVPAAVWLNSARTLTSLSGLVPTNFGTLSIDGSGKVALQSAEYTAIANALQTAVVDGSINTKQATAIMLAVLAGGRTDGALNTGTHQQTVTYKRQDGTTTILTNTVQYGTNNTTTTGRTASTSNLP